MHVLTLTASKLIRESTAVVAASLSAALACLRNLVLRYICCVGNVRTYTIRELPVSDTSRPTYRQDVVMTVNAV